MSQRIVPVRLWDAQDLDNTGTLTSPAIDCRKADPEFLMFRITNSGGNADAKIEVAISNDGTNFNSFTSQPALVASTATDYASLNPEEYHTINVPSAPWIKIQITELATLDNNVVHGTLWVREL
jgi:hypothetical protein